MVSPAKGSEATTASCTSSVLLLLLLQQQAHISCEARIVGVWTDIENHAEIVGEYLANASAIARSAKLRLAVDAQVGWAFEANTVDPSRPVHQQVMDIADEITLMDYFTSCTNTSAGGGGGACDPTQAIYLAAPWLTYAAFLQKNRNRTVLLDLGVAVDSPWAHGRISSEVELERFFKTTGGFLRGQMGGSSFHNFAIFTGGAYKGIAEAHPCTNATCGPVAQRQSRAIWYYGMFGGHVHSTWKPNNATEMQAAVNWWAARRVTEVYVDQYCIDPTGGCGTAPANVRPSWDAFLHATDTAGIDVYLYVGDGVGPSGGIGGTVPETVSNVAAFCNHSTAASGGRGICGPRLSRIPDFVSGGKSKFPSRAAAAAGCAAAGDVLCTKAELKGHAGCEIGWCSDWKGYWMWQASKGCGNAGYNAARNSSAPAGAWCCQSVR